MRTRGLLNTPAAVRTLRVDDVTLTHVVDGTMWLDRGRFLPAVPESYWAAHPDELDPRGRVVMAAGALLVRRGHHRVLVDAGYGPAAVDSPFGRVESGRLPAVLAGLGTDPADVDVLALTHLHVDHTGWAFRPGADGPVPVFPEADYRASAAETEPYRAGDEPVGAPDRTSVVEPLLRRVRPVADGEEVAPGVSALVTPGHSPGHTSYVVTSSSGARVVAFGDVFHAPAQLADPRWPSAPDVDACAVPAARARILDELDRPDTVGFACHFGDQPFGRVQRDRAGTRRWSPLPAPVDPRVRPG